jgi:RNA polymerase sigma factor (sigma-70 family)
VSAGASKILEFPKPASFQVRDERILAHLPLVETAAKSISKQLRLKNYFDLDDLKGAGYIGLIHAAERYQPSLNVPFEKYARKRINGAILDSVRRANWRDATQEHLEDDFEGIVRKIADPAPSPEETVREYQNRRDLTAAIAELEPEERAVIHLAYAGKSLRKIGKRMDLKLWRVGEVKRSAECRLRRHFALRGRKVAA